MIMTWDAAHARRLVSVAPAVVIVVARAQVTLVPALLNLLHMA